LHVPKATAILYKGKNSDAAVSVDKSSGNVSASYLISSLLEEGIGSSINLPLPVNRPLTLYLSGLPVLSEF
jgi:hypothetical protein